MEPLRDCGMRSFHCLRGAAFASAVGLLSPIIGIGTLWAQDVLTERYDNGRTGAVVEPINPKTFQQGWHKIGELPVAGRIYAQPLFVHGLQIGPSGPPRNVVFIATEQNNVYAFDADSLAPIWFRSLGRNDQTRMGSAGCDDISPEGIGIEATPAIDRNAQRIFVSYRVNEKGSPDTAHQEVVALDLRVGITVAGPIEVTGESFVPRWERSRASLLIQNGQVFVAFASRCEDPGMPIFHGFVYAFDENKLSQSGVFQVTNGDLDGGGIWQASSGLAGDGGDIYFMSGNRRLEVGSQPADTFNYADSILRLRPQPVSDSSLSFVVQDWFTPYRKLWLDEVDLDLGSAGPVLIPGTQYLLGGGKQGWLYLVDRNNMGKLDNDKKWKAANIQSRDIGHRLAATEATGRLFISYSGLGRLICLRKLSS